MFFTRMLCFSGLKNRNAAEIWEETDARMRSTYTNPIKSFPHKIDQLLQALNRVCQ
jgi:hypothetical protein